MVELQGLEPWTSSMPWKRSSQLSYSPTILTLGEWRGANERRGCGQAKQCRYFSR